MITLGRLNSLLVLQEMLDEPKSLKDLHQRLVVERQNKEIPILLPGGLEEFLREEVRYGTVQCVPNGVGVKYQVSAAAAEGIRAELASAFTPDGKVNQNGNLSLAG
jgi:hypothetical protein